MAQKCCTTPEQIKEAKLVGNICCVCHLPISFEDRQNAGSYEIKHSRHNHSNLIGSIHTHCATKLDFKTPKTHLINECGND